MIPFKRNNGKYSLFTCYIIITLLFFNISVESIKNLEDNDELLLRKPKYMSHMHCVERVNLCIFSEKWEM